MEETNPNVSVLPSSVARGSCDSQVASAVPDDATKSEATHARYGESIDELIDLQVTTVDSKPDTSEVPSSSTHIEEKQEVNEGEPQDRETHGHLIERVATLTGQVSELKSELTASIQSCRQTWVKCQQLRGHLETERKGLAGARAKLQVMERKKLRLL